ncbi:MAG: hypothetical protein BWY21_01009 [Parcubacteria group bacterium ADurb.Bin216]|nr:MAG: hypothetical protein BWY21_01009 [Parcubacteria group bacterium ADurb.Bin216]
MTHEEQVAKMQSVEGCLELVELAAVEIKSLIGQPALATNQSNEFRKATVNLHAASVMLLQYGAVQYQLGKMAEMQMAAEKAKVNPDVKH